MVVIAEKAVTVTIQQLQRDKWSPTYYNMLQCNCYNTTVTAEGRPVPYISSLRLKMCPVSAKVGGGVVNDDGIEGR